MAAFRILRHQVQDYRAEALRLAGRGAQPVTTALPEAEAAIEAKAITARRQVPEKVTVGIPGIPRGLVTAQEMAVTAYSNIRPLVRLVLSRFQGLIFISSKTISATSTPICKMEPAHCAMALPMVWALN
jgi:NAD(P)-dependent dehydrogenase (short-subunit alcohol dehydrogenase family)